MAADLGIVAIGRNEGDRLIRCLTSINLASTNIVYVDLGSTDGSAITADKLGARVIALDLTQPFTAARARNEGFAAVVASNPQVRFVQFVDGDCALVQGWLGEAQAFLEARDDIAIVCGRRRELNPRISIYNLLCEFEWDTPIGEAISCGGDFMVRVAAFQAAGGLRSQLIAGEEPELCVRLREMGWRIWRLNSEMTRHDATMTRMRQFWIRAVRCGHAYAEVSWLHKSSMCGIWRRETLRALFWGALLPVIICIGTLFHPAVIAGVLLTPYKYAGSP